MKVKSLGFTLVELLVVIAIIALLLSILMPSLSAVRENARKVVCQSNIRQIGLGFSQYAIDNAGVFGEGWLYPEPVPGYQGVYWPNEIGSYVGDAKKIFVCPTASIADSSAVAYAKRYQYLQNERAFGKTKKPWIWPWSLPHFRIMRPGDICSYGRNAWATNPRPTHLTAKHWKGPNASNPQNIPLLADAVWVELWPDENHAPPAYPDTEWNGMQSFVMDRHGKGTINMLFLDSSGRTVGLKELWTLKWHRSYNTASRYTSAGGMPNSEWPLWMRKFKQY